MPLTAATTRTAASTDCFYVSERKGVAGGTRIRSRKVSCTLPARAVVFLQILVCVSSCFLHRNNGACFLPKGVFLVFIAPSSDSLCAGACFLCFLLKACFLFRQWFYDGTCFLFQQWFSAGMCFLPFTTVSTIQHSPPASTVQLTIQARNA